MGEAPEGPGCWWKPGKSGADWLPGFKEASTPTGLHRIVSPGDSGCNPVGVEVQEDTAPQGGSCLATLG